VAADFNIYTVNFLRTRAGACATGPSAQSELHAAAQSFRDASAYLHHTVLDLWEAEDGMVAELMDVHYRRLDSRGLNLVCCNVFGVNSGVVNDYRVYMDANPIPTP
jgi:hypothetical protein